MLVKTCKELKCNRFLHAHLLVVVLLRAYPPRFGLKMVKLLPRFCRTRPTFFGTPLDEEDVNLGVHLFNSLSWSCSHDAEWWPDARLESVFRYLRGSKGLHLGSFRPMLPTHI